MHKYVTQFLNFTQSLPAGTRKLLKMITDSVIIFAAYQLAWMARFEWAIPLQYKSQFLISVPIMVVVSMFAFCLCGAYSDFWVYWSYRDLKKLLFAHTVTVVVLFGINSLFRSIRIPRSIFLIYWVFSIQFLAFIRIIYRIMIDTWGLKEKKGMKKKRVLAIGAGEAAEMLVQSMHRDKYKSYNIVGLIDDNPQKYKRRIHGIPVLGNRFDIESVTKEYNIDEIMLAIPSASSADMQAIVRICSKTGIPYKTLPGPRELIDGQVHINQIREVAIDDLLGREQGDMDEKRVSKLIRNKRILITGAAGSIGSELCRQILKFHPEQMIMIDKDENRLFYLENELFDHTKISAYVMPIQDRRRLWDIFDIVRPQLVFHAAAYKHVPSLEKNPEEAILNNLGATITLSKMAREFKVKKFIQISTDKAVNPVNIMGASKRLCELYCQYMAQKSSKGYISVRFGNVIGSQGSVFTVFQQQIRKGGPVTITHPTMTRFFMSIQEACRLVLEAAALGKGGCIFVLDMGDPISIKGLAEQMIRLSGFEPNKEIPIKLTGFRPGEKMHEELWYAHEIPETTVNPKVFKSKVDNNLGDEFLTHIDNILASARSLDTQKMYKHINCLIPELSVPHRIISTPDLRRGE